MAANTPRPKPQPHDIVFWFDENNQLHVDLIALAKHLNIQPTKPKLLTLQTATVEILNNLVPNSETLIVATTGHITARKK